MTKDINEQISVMQAFAIGKKVECFPKHTHDAFWHEATEPTWNWFTNDYRVKPPEPDTVPWEHIKPEYKFAARDNDDRIFVYGSMPSTSSDQWVCDNGDPADAVMLTAFKGVIIGGLNWKDSLVERPVDK